MAKWPLTLSRNVRISDLIAAGAILISGFGIVFSINQANDLVRREQERNEREAAVRAIARLDRWQAVQSSLHHQLQPIIIRTTEVLRDTRSPEQARDLFWREVVAADAELDRRIVSEQLDTGYEDVLVYLPRSRQLYLNTYTALEQVAQNRIDRLLSEAQEAIMTAPPESHAVTATLGNRLRDIVAENFALLGREAEGVTRDPRQTFCQRITQVAEDVQICAAPGRAAGK